MHVVARATEFGLFSSKFHSFFPFHLQTNLANFPPTRPAGCCLFLTEQSCSLKRLVDTTCPNPLIDPRPPYHLTRLQRDRSSAHLNQLGLLIHQPRCKGFLREREHIHYLMEGTVSNYRQQLTILGSAMGWLWNNKIYQA